MPHGTPNSASLYKNSVLYGAETLSCTEDKRNTPDTRKGYDRIYYSAQEGVLTAAYPRDDIKSENTYATPVECAYYGYDQGNSVHNHDNSSFETVFPFKVSFGQSTEFYV